MKKHGQFFSGMAAMALLGLLTTGALAATDQVAFNQAGIRMFGNAEVQVGENIIAPNGQEVPGVITYTDASGNTTNYLSVRKVAELFDAPVSWDSATNSVVLGRSTSQKSDVQVTTGSEGDGAAQLPTTPKIGAVAGPFTEVAPGTTVAGSGAMVWLNRASIQSDTGIRQRFSCVPGGVVELSVTNNGTTDQTMNVYRPITVSEGGMETFQSIRIPAGKTLTRSFQVSADATALTRVLEMNVDSGAVPGISDLVITAKEYLPKTK